MIYTSTDTDPRHYVAWTVNGRRYVSPFGQSEFYARNLARNLIDAHLVDVDTLPVILALPADPTVSLVKIDPTDPGTWAEGNGYVWREFDSDAGEWHFYAPDGRDLSAAYYAHLDDRRAVIERDRIAARLAFMAAVQDYGWSLGRVDEAEERRVDARLRVAEYVAGKTTASDWA